jgi:hypothetical protein
MNCLCPKQSLELPEHNFEILIKKLRYKNYLQQKSQSKDWDFLINGVFVLLIKSLKTTNKNFNLSHIN